MEVTNIFLNLNLENIQWLNSRNIVLLPKKDVPEKISDY
jgi:hypothetical protein